MNKILDIVTSRREQRPFALLKESCELADVSRVGRDRERRESLLHFQVVKKAGDDIRISVGKHEGQYARYRTLREVLIQMHTAEFLADRRCKQRLSRLTNPLGLSFRAEREICFLLATAYNRFFVAPLLRMTISGVCQQPETLPATSLWKRRDFLQNLYRIQRSLGRVFVLEIGKHVSP